MYAGVDPFMEVLQVMWAGGWPAPVFTYAVVIVMNLYHILLY